MAIASAAWLLAAAIPSSAADVQVSTLWPLESATLLEDGRVLLTDGDRAEILDVAAGTFTPVAGRPPDRRGYTTSLLPDGRVLLAGGWDDEGDEPSDAADVFDPATGIFTSVARMTARRSGHSATRLPDGRVLVAGGGTAETFDPLSGAFTRLGVEIPHMGGHTATLLADGRVLLAGGAISDEDDIVLTPTPAVLLDPTMGEASIVGPTAAPFSAAVLLRDGRVLLVGGQDADDEPIASAQVFDPAAGTLTEMGEMSSPRIGPAAQILPDGRVLVVGGWGRDAEALASGDGETQALTSAELYDPASGTFSETGALSRPPREDQLSIRRPDGQVVMLGSTPSRTVSFETYDPASGRFTWRGVTTIGGDHTATLLRDGRVLLMSSDSAELYDPATTTFRATGRPATSTPGGRSATLMEDGHVLIAGGSVPGCCGLASAEVFDPETGRFSPTGEMTRRRLGPQAVPLPGGDVLVVGGEWAGNRAVRDVERYDPQSGTFRRAGRLQTGRLGATATLLADGRVLVAGGDRFVPIPGDVDTQASAELYDPARETFVPTGAMATPRARHSATLLADGRVLVAGGRDGQWRPVRLAELYGPAIGRFRPAGALRVARHGHSATLLSDGRVLILGGFDGRGRPIMVAEIYDPARGRSRRAGSLPLGGSGHSATALADGRVLIVASETAWLFDPSSGSFTAVAPTFRQGPPPPVGAAGRRGWPVLKTP